jgi:uncharacterized protein
MKILALSDVHRSYDLARTIAAAEKGVDAIVIAGDLTTNGKREEAVAAVATLRAVVPSVVAISGNMDSREIDAGYSSAGVSIDSTGILLGDCGFCGVSGAPVSFMHTPYERSEEELFTCAERGWKKIASQRWKIFVPHAPPEGTKLDLTRLGTHVGSSGIRKFVETYQPDLLVCGHIHESRGMDSFGKTHMVNCGPAQHGYYATIEINDGISIELKQL